MLYNSFMVCLVKLILEREREGEREREREREREWLDGEFSGEGREERKLVGARCFLLRFTKTQSPQIREIIGEKTRWLCSLLLLDKYSQSINVRDVLDLLAFFFLVFSRLFFFLVGGYMFFLENSFGLISYAFLFIFILLKCPSIHNFFKKYLMCYFLFY